MKTPRFTPERIAADEANAMQAKRDALYIKVKELQRDRAVLVAALRSFASLDISHMAHKDDGSPVFRLNNTTMFLYDIRNAKELLRRLDRESLTGKRDE